MLNVVFGVSISYNFIVANTFIDHFLIHNLIHFKKKKKGIHFKCSGTTGHGSLLHKNTAGEKVRYIIDQFMDFRQEEVLKLENNPELDIGNVTTVNLTILKGGVQSNVVPPLLTVVFDVRLAPDVNHEDFEKMVTLIHF